MTPRIARVAAPGREAREAVLGVLGAANAAAGYPPTGQDFALGLHDPEGQMAGGLWGRVLWSWLYVELLAVAPGLRRAGWGARLLATAEAAALADGCVGVRLDTYSFQAALGFYQRQGYAVAGAIPDCPPGHTRYTMMKRLG